MRKTYLLTPLVLLTSIAFYFLSCKKEEIREEPSGSIAGQIAPPNAVSSIRLIKPSGDSSALNVDGDGKFLITGLLAGTYYLRFSFVGYVGPDYISVRVVSGEKTDLGVLNYLLSAAGSTPLGYGSIVGKVSPPDGITRVLAKGASKTYPYSTSVATTGEFAFNVLPPDSYEISFEAGVAYNPLPPRTVIVAANSSNNLGTISPTAISNTYRPFDTLAGVVRLATTQQVNSFIARAANDSAIVFLETLSIQSQAISPAFQAALNKVIVAKGGVQITGDGTTVLELKGLKEAGGVTVQSSQTITRIDLPALQSAFAFRFAICPSLTTLNVPLLRNYNSGGGLYLYNTGFKDLSMLSGVTNISLSSVSIINNTSFTSFTGLNFTVDTLYSLQITGNPVLTSIEGLLPIKKVAQDISISNNALLTSLNGLNNFVSARQITLYNNVKLATICPAKKFLKYMSTAPQVTTLEMNALGNYVSVKKDALLANNNGAYASRAALLAAVDACP